MKIICKKWQNYVFRCWANRVSLDLHMIKSLHFQPVSCLSEQAFLFILPIRKLGPKITQLVHSSVTSGTESFNPLCYFLATYQLSQGNSCHSQLEKIFWRIIFFFLTKIIHTTGVRPPSCLHSLANLKLTQVQLWSKENMFLKVSTV